MTNTKVRQRQRFDPVPEIARKTKTETKTMTNTKKRQRFDLVLYIASDIEQCYLQW